LRSHLSIAPCILEFHAQISDQNLLRTYETLYYRSSENELEMQDWRP
jgi:hypothetical protein